MAPIDVQKFRPTPSLEPVSAQLASYFRSAIESRQYKPNQKLPTTKQIVDSFGVSTHTVRDAMGILEAEGLITMAPRKGTFVNYKFPFQQNGERSKNGAPKKQAATDGTPAARRAVIGVFGLVSHGSALGDWDSFRVDSARGSVLECDRQGLAMLSLPIFPGMTGECCVEMAQHYGCDGVLWCDEDHGPLENFAQADIPAVLMCRNQPSQAKYSAVCLDYYKAGRDVAEMILQSNPAHPPVNVVHIEYPVAHHGAYANHFLSGLQSYEQGKPYVHVRVETWSIRELHELLGWLQSLEKGEPVIFICSYHLLGLMANYREETEAVFQGREVFAISNREPNMQLLACRMSFNPYIIYDDFSKLSSVGVQKLVTCMGGLLDNTSTTIQMPIDRLSEFGVGGRYHLQYAMNS